MTRIRQLRTLTAFRMRRIAEMRLALNARRVPAVRSYLFDRFVADLRDLNDVLRHTELHGHYWVWSGLLLGWAREGQILAHDSLDADFAVLDEDFPRLISATSALMRAGFRCDRRFVNNSGVVTEVTFMRRGAGFDFFRMFPVADRLRYYMYAPSESGQIEIQASQPAQATTWFRFLDRDWLKHEDHDLELRSIYGEWKIPDPSWSYVNGLDIEARSTWLQHSWDWRGGAPALMDDPPP